MQPLVPQVCKKAEHNCLMSHCFTSQWVWVCTYVSNLHFMAFYLDGIMNICTQCSLYLQYPPSPHPFQLHLVKHLLTLQISGNTPSSEKTSLTPWADCRSYSFSPCQTPLLHDLHCSLQLCIPLGCFLFSLPASPMVISSMWEAQRPAYSPL